MFKRHNFLILVLACSSLLISAANAADPSMIGWWKLDEGSGATANDSSGKNNHGTINNVNAGLGPDGSVWAQDPELGTVASFNGNDTAGAYIAAGSIRAMNMTNDFTWAFWCKQDADGTGVNQCILGNRYGGTESPLQFIKFTPTNFEYYNGALGGIDYVDLPADVWIHHAVVKKGAALTYYRDAVNTNTAAVTYTIDANPFFIGGDAAGERWRGWISDVRIYDRALSESEIKSFAARPKAREPQPADGAQNVGRFENYGLLSWKAGTFAAWHNVYFGTNPTPGPAEFKARQPLANTFFFPIRDAGVSYYWRIDEEDPNGLIRTGDVWSFSTAPLDAHSPIPADNSEFVDPNVDLSWGAGFDATTHDVYFGTDYTAVENATPATAGIFKGNQATTVYDTGTLPYEATYYWRIDEKEAGGTRKGDVWTFTTGTTKQGTVVREIWRDITPTGDGLDLLKNWWKFPDQPDDVDSLTVFTSPQTSPDIEQYGGRIHGWLHVPSEGQYTFWVAGDNETELWLSTDEDPANVQLIAELSGWTAYQSFDEQASQESAPMSLTPGKYYIMALWKEGAGGDHCAAAWQGPPSPERQVIPGIYLSPFEALWARSPSPANGATDVSRVADLEWLPGIHATKHRVYLGTDPDAVKNATTASPEYKTEMTVGNETYDPGILAWNKTCYWRIDEVNDLHPDSPWVGRVWSFTVADYLVVDDFEDYNDYTPDRIFESWLDGFGYGAAPPSPPPYYPGNGTGSIIGYDTPPFAEETIVHAGDQSMPYFYFNNLPNKSKYSEATKTLTYPRDWTEEGVKALTLWFRGYPASTGSYSYNTGTGVHTITASGTDIWDVSGRGTGFHDEFHYAYQVLSGEGSITAQVLSVENTNDWAKAGVMIRDTLDANSAHSFVCVTPTQGVAWQYRLTPGGGSTNDTQVTGILAPHWVKIARDISGTVTASHSADNGTWETMGTPIMTSMTTPMYIGLALTSHNAAAICEATFSNVSIVGGGGAWGHADIGIISNEAQPMYVAVSNSNGTTGVVTHPDQDVALTSTWTEWNIPLTEFSNQGVVLTNVDSVSIGFGNRNNPVAGGSGTMYFDDIRLYRGRCFPTLVKPTADFSNNCVVDFPDLEIMTNNWLISDWQVTPTAPGTTGLALYYEFQGNLLDSSGNGHIGDPCGTTVGYAPGQVGQALSLDGTAYVNAGSVGIDSNDARTIAGWVRASVPAASIGDWSNCFGFTNSLTSGQANRSFDIERRGGQDFYCVHVYSWERNLAPVDDQWHHLAATYDGTNIKGYADGHLAVSEDRDLNTIDNVNVGRRGDIDSRFPGLIDEVRIYNRVLSQDQIGWLAGKTAPYTQQLYLLLAPQDPAINMNGDGRIDFKDYALLADTWLEVVLWP